MRLDALNEGVRGVTRNRHQVSFGSLQLLPGREESDSWIDATTPRTFFAYVPDRFVTNDPSENATDSICISLQYWHNGFDVFERTAASRSGDV